MREPLAKKAFLAALIIILFNLLAASRVIVQVPLVDGWAVWNRLMQLDFDEISLADYLFTPHGAHPHSIVFLVAWLDLHWGGAQQYIMEAISYAAILACALFIAMRVVTYVKALGASASTQIMAALAAGALMSSLADYETLMQPFQVVMSVSRLTYLLLIWFLIKSFRDRSLKSYFGIVFLATISVTFHGAGFIFAGTFLLLHMVLARRWWMLIGGIMPAVAAKIMNSIFAQSGGELSHLDALLSIDKIWIFIKGVCAYFVTPLMQSSLDLEDPALLTIGGLMMVATATMTLVCFAKTVSVRMTSYVQPQKNGIQQDEVIFAWAMGLFILMSAAAAAAVWIVRNTVIPGSPDEIYPLIIGTTRYTSYASLSYVLLICLVVRFSRGSENLKYFRPVICLLLLVLALVPAFTLKKNYGFDDDLNKATSGLAVGLSPLLPETDAVWPGAAGDWYWVTALPKTIAYLHAEHKGPWKTLPDVHAIGAQNGRYVSIKNLRFAPLASDVDGTRCEVSGMLAEGRNALFSRSLLVPIVNTGKEVIGFVTVVRQGERGSPREFQGFALCTDIRNAGSAIYIALGKTTWQAPKRVKVSGVPPTNISDQTWENGVARKWAGFFVEATPANRGIFVRGRILRFANGHLRTVLKGEVANGYLNVMVDGPNLDGSLVGYPHQIRPLN